MIYIACHIPCVMIVRLIGIHQVFANDFWFLMLLYLQEDMPTQLEKQDTNETKIDSSVSATRRSETAE